MRMPGCGTHPRAQGQTGASDVRPPVLITRLPQLDGLRYKLPTLPVQPRRATTLAPSMGHRASPSFPVPCPKPG
jgi:hypothetical protein